MGSFFDTLIKSIGNFYETGNSIYKVIKIILSVLVFHKAFYFVFGIYDKKSYKERALI